MLFDSWFTAYLQHHHGTFRQSGNRIPETRFEFSRHSSLEEEKPQRTQFEIQSAISR